MIFITRGDQLSEWEDAGSDESSFLIVKHIEKSIYQVQSTYFSLEDLKVVCAQPLEDQCYYICIVPALDIIYLIKAYNYSYQIEEYLNNFANTINSKEEFKNLFKK